jgi:RNA polymerase sigma-70 factor (ECF subfamily)
VGIEDVGGSGGVVTDAEVATDAALMAAHADGDPDAFGELVRRHRDRLWAVALRTLGDREEAADAVQDALVSAFRAGRGGSAWRGDSAVTTWLHRIVVNACLDRVRRRAARPADPLPEQEVATARDDLGAQLTRLDVTAALATLPAEQRAALVLVDMYGWPVDEAARVLDCPVGTIKSRCARGRARLLPLLRAGNPEPAPDVPPPDDRAPDDPATNDPAPDDAAPDPAGRRGGEQP